MFIFFTIPFLWIAFAILVVLGIGLQIVEFIATYIVVINILVGLLALWAIVAVWKMTKADRICGEVRKLEDTDEVVLTLGIFSQVPTYAMVVQYILECSRNTSFMGLLGLIIYVPLVLGVCCIIGIGLVFLSCWVGEHFLKRSIAGTMILGTVLIAMEGLFLWHIRW